LKTKAKENNKRGKVQQSGEGGVAEPEPFSYKSIISTNNKIRLLFL
jgi:hypothetical protein